MTRSISFAGAVLSALVVLALTVVVNLSHTAQYREEVRGSVLQKAALVRAKLEEAVNTRLYVAYGLAAFAKLHPDQEVAEREFGDFAEGLRELQAAGVKGLRSLQLAPNAVVRHVYPKDGNEAIIGHDLLRDASRRDAVQAAIDGNVFLVSGPVRLIQGGSGLIARLPVFLPPEGAAGDGAPKEFWGFATVVLDVPPILEAAGLLNRNRSIEVAVRGKDAQGPDGATFFGDPDLFRPDAQAIHLGVSLPEGSWQLAARPPGGWPLMGPLTPVILATGVVLAGVLGWAVRLILIAPVSLREQVKVAVQALHDSEERFAKVAETATDGLMSFAEDGRMVFLNGAARQLLCLDDAAVGSLTVEDVLAYPGGRPCDVRDGRVTSMQGRRRDGTVVPVEVTFSTWEAAGRRFRSVIMRDVSERLQAEEERLRLRERLYQAQKIRAISTLAEGTAHEFSNILNSALANAEAAAASLPPDSEAAAAVDEAITANWRAADLVRKLLVFAQGQASETKPMAVELGHVIASSVAAFAARNNVPVPVSATADGAEARVCMDVSHLGDLLEALLSNAWDAIADGGTISVRLDRVVITHPRDVPPPPHEACIEVAELGQGTFARLSVMDTGAGIPRETLEQVFDPFFTTKAPGRGTGLGLSVAHGVAIACGGAIRLSSAEGEGTVAEVYLPLAPQAVAEKAVDA